MCVRKSPLPYANSCRVWSMREGLLRVQSERLELPAPLGRRIAKTLHANAAGQATLNRGSDEIRREERERDGHVNLANAAFFAGGDLFKFGDFARWLHSVN